MIYSHTNHRLGRGRKLGKPAPETSIQMDFATWLWTRTKIDPKSLIGDLTFIWWGF